MLCILLTLMFCILPDVKIRGATWQYNIYMYINYHNKAIGYSIEYCEKLLCALSDLNEGTVYMDVLLIET